LIKAAGFDLLWGNDNEKVLVALQTGEVITWVNTKFYHPAEADLMVGDAAKAKPSKGSIGK